MISRDKSNPAPQPISFRVNCNDSVKQFSDEQLFAQGHRLLLAGHYSECMPVFE